jgi:RNA polymerase sigma-70 factor (ECF subfamily)
MDDNQIIQEYLETKNQELFRILVERYQKKVFRLALSILGAHFSPEAEHVAQEVFLQVYRRLREFRMESTFSTWLYRITYNHAIEYKRRARLRLPHTDVESLDAIQDLKDSDNPFTALMDKERREILLCCMNQLPELYSSVLNLHYWMGYSVEEIGEVLGAPIGTVKSYLHRARARLSHQLKKRGFKHEQALS